MTERAKRNRYTDEFKEAAVAMVVRDGKSINEVALELGISSWTLRCWRKKQLGEAGSAECDGRQLSATELDKENRELRRELERVKRQREILKKTLGIISEE